MAFAEPPKTGNNAASLEQKPTGVNPGPASEAPARRRSTTLPLVALVGRANVGKSRLFNRLSRRPRALVRDRPGVTRDRIVGPARIEGRRVLLVDTGGLDPEAEEGVPAAVQRQIQQVLESASLILFIVDSRQGILPLDHEIAQLLRRADTPLVVVANKADGPLLDAQAGEFHALGLGSIIPISAEHNRGIADLELRIAELLPPEERTGPEEEAEHRAPRLAIVGRPNVGKSSLLNRLLGEDRAIVSEVPGTTRDAGDTHLTHGGRELILVDTAGLRRQGRRADPLERGSAFMALQAIRQADLALLVLDASTGITDQDAKIARLALDCGRPLLLVLNKWDLVRSAERRNECERELQRKLRFVREPALIRVSALTGQGLAPLLPRAFELLDEARRQASTADVNRALQEALERNPPPAGGRRPARFFYATQTSKRPFTVLIFMNNPSLIPRNYKKYLESFFRNYFGVRSAPLRLRLRARPRGDSDDAPNPG